MTSDRSVTALATTPQAPRRRYRVADSTTPSRIKPRHGFVAFGQRRPGTTATCKKLRQSPFSAASAISR